MLCCAVPLYAGKSLLDANVDVGGSYGNDRYYVIEVQFYIVIHLFALCRILLNKSVIDHLVEYRILHVGSVGTILLQNTVVLIGTKLVAEGKVGAKIIGELI